MPASNARVSAKRTPLAQRALARNQPKRFTDSKGQNDESSSAATPLAADPGLFASDLAHLGINLPRH